jgi:hypothetical protein
MKWRVMLELVGPAARQDPAAQAVSTPGEFSTGTRGDYSAGSHIDVLRDFTEVSYAAKSWPHPRRVVARIKATRKGLDTRYVVTKIAHCAAEWLYSGLYCARGHPTRAAPACSAPPRPRVTPRRVQP